MILFQIFDVPADARLRERHSIRRERKTLERRDRSPHSARRKNNAGVFGLVINKGFWRTGFNSA